MFEYLTKLKEILLYTGVSDCNMEEGSLRCDANVSVMLKGAKEFGTKAEVKNVNSFRYIRSAVEYEIERQIGVLEDGGRVVQESRLWNSVEGRTYSMRSKEQAHDYRYFPEPDLPPLVVGKEWQAEILKMLPELPEARRARMIAEYEISCAGRSDPDGDSGVCGQVRGGGEEGEESETRRCAVDERVDDAAAAGGAGAGAVAGFDGGDRDGGGSGGVG